MKTLAIAAACVVMIGGKAFAQAAMGGAPTFMPMQPVAAAPAQAKPMQVAKARSHTNVARKSSAMKVAEHAR